MFFEKNACESLIIFLYIMDGLGIAPSHGCPYIGHLAVNCRNCPTKHWSK
jgi:hypothetical protein